jgi:hypothetical protein
MTSGAGDSRKEIIIFKITNSKSVARAKIVGGIRIILEGKIDLIHGQWVQGF